MSGQGIYANNSHSQYVENWNRCDTDPEYVNKVFDTNSESTWMDSERGDDNDSSLYSPITLYQSFRTLRNILCVGPMLIVAWPNLTLFNRCFWRRIWNRCWTKRPRRSRMRLSCGFKNAPVCFWPVRNSCEQRLPYTVYKEQSGDMQPGKMSLKCMLSPQPGKMSLKKHVVLPAR